MIRQTVERVLPYEGNEPYIFISYSHRDMALVMPIVRALTEHGYRLWYDEGIDPGSEWPESIASHLAGSSVCMYFISENSLASSNCKREINFALSREIGFLSVALEPAEMPLGLELQISSYMSLVRYKYPSDEIFMERLLSLEILKPCLKEKEPEKQPVPEESATADDEVKSTVRETVEPARIKPVKEKKPKIKEKKAKEPKLSEKKSPLKLIVAGILAAAVLAAILLVKSGSSSKKDSITIGENTYTVSSYINIQNETLSQEDISKILSKEECTSLYFTDCTFENQTVQMLGDKVNLTRIDFQNCSGIDSLAFTAKLEKLREFRADHCSITDEMLEASAFGENLEIVSMQNNSLTVLPDLTACSSLKELYFTGNQISDISGLSANHTIKKLYIAQNQISDLSVLETFIYLQEINIASNSVASLQPLHNCTVLSRVNISYNSDITDLSVIAANSSTLTELWACGLPQADFSVLSECTNLTVLNINSSNIADISFLRNMNSLQILNAADNQITDLSALQNCSALYTMNLSDNQLSNLNGFPQTTGKETIYVLLNGNQLTELSGLPAGKDYDLLTLSDNPWESTAQLKELSGYYLVLDYTPVFNKEDLNVFTRVYITSVDLSEQLALENTLGTRLHYADLDEIIAEAAEYFSYAHIVLP